MRQRKKKLYHPGHATPGEALQYLVSVCDGAIKRDGLGFGIDDIEWGRHLAARDQATWTHAEQQQALRLVRVYQRQLYNAGFNPRAILARTRRRKMSRRADAKLTPGWFPDPTGFDVWRYWNGARWTHHLAAAVPANNEPLYAASP